MAIPETFGSPEHFGLIVSDVQRAMEELRVLGYRFAPIATPLAHIQRGDGQVEKTHLQYVTSGGAKPYLKVIGEVPGTYWTQDVPGTAWHHATYWVYDIDEATKSLAASGFVIDADGLEADGTLRYRYLRSAEGIRIELGLRANRREFEEWAAQAE